MDPIYLDYNATTPVDPRVSEAMLPWLRDHFGNPSSGHVYGLRTNEAVARARLQVASAIGARPDEIVFTGGGSEANNQALKGVVAARQRGLFKRMFGSGNGDHIVISAIEHPAITEPCSFLERLGCRITRVKVDRTGLVDPDDVRRALDGGATLVSVMHSNNEVGTLQPVREIAALCRARGVLCHTDAAQSVGKVPLDVAELGVDLLSVAGHKLYAPKGVGALYVRSGVNVEPLIHGAAHEGGRRAGTENVPYIIALGEACRLAEESLPGATSKLRILRDRLHDHLKKKFGESLTLLGHPENRLPNTLNVNFAGQAGSELLTSTPGIAVSTGSACHEGQVGLSAVLHQMGIKPREGSGSVRLSVGRFTTSADVDRAAALLAETVLGVRA